MSRSGQSEEVTHKQVYFSQQGRRQTTNQRLHIKFVARFQVPSANVRENDSDLWIKRGQNGRIED